MSQSKNSYIKRVVQKGLLCRMAWHWCFALLAIAAGMVITHYFTVAPVRPEMTFGEHATQALRSNALLLAMLAALVPIFMRDSLRVTNRLVAPLEDIKSAMDELARGGTPQPIAPQKAKCWAEFAEAIERTADRLRLLEARPEVPARPSIKDTIPDLREEPVGV